MFACAFLYKMYEYTNGTTASAIEKAVPELVAKGYQLVTVSELLSFHKDGITPGTVYAYLDPDNIDTSK